MADEPHEGDQPVDSVEEETRRIMDAAFGPQTESKRSDAIADRLRAALDPGESMVSATTAKLAPTIMGGNGVLLLTQSRVIHVEHSPKNRSTLVFPYDEIANASVTGASNNNANLTIWTRDASQEFVIGTGALKSFDVAGRKKDAAAFCERIVSRIADTPFRGLQRVELKKVDYLGGHGSLEPVKNITLELMAGGITGYKPHPITAVQQRILDISWQNVEALAVEGPEQFERRVTLTRMLTVGVFAFAWKKKTGQTFLTLTVDGVDVGFFVEGKAPMEIAPLVQPFQRAVEAARPAAASGAGNAQATTAPDPLEMIRRLQELREAGALSEAEFEAKKAELLKRI